MEENMDLSDLDKIKEEIFFYLLKQEKLIQNKKEELLKQKEEIIKEIELMNYNINQSEQKTDPNFSVFSPSSKEIRKKEDWKNEILNLKSQYLNIEKLLQESDNDISYILKISGYIQGIEKYNKSNSGDLINNSGELGIILLEAQENERKRIARDLHDTTVQNLTNLIHKTELSLRLADIDSIRMKLELETMISTIRSTINDMRSIIYNLRPMSLDDLGLAVTIQRFLDEIKKTYPVKINFKNNEKDIKMMTITKMTLFRVLQEACNNIIKHSHASIVNIDLNFSDDNVTLTIEDNGIGFDISKTKNDFKNNRTSFGLSIMIERVYLLSGEIKIESKINCGTKILIEVPLHNTMEEL